jgi:hypothetical protein
MHLYVRREEIVPCQTSKLCMRSYTVSASQHAALATDRYGRTDDVDDPKGRQMCSLEYGNRGHEGTG